MSDWAKQSKQGVREGEPEATVEAPRGGRSRDWLRLLAGTAGVVVVAWLILRGGGTRDESSHSAAPSGVAGPISEATARAVSGIYRIESLTENDAGCEAPGKAVATTGSTHVVVESAMIMNTRAIYLIFCIYPEQCASTRSSVQAGKNYGTEFGRWVIEEKSPTEFRGFYAMGGYPDPDKGVCSQRRYEDLALTVSKAGELRFELRKKALPDRPMAGRGCSMNTDEVKSEAASVPCSSNRILTARRTE